MDCPNCGAKLPEGKLYCENCGAELQIVPDFDIDIDSEMKKTMKNIVDSEFKDDELFDEDPSIVSLFLNNNLKKHINGKLYYVFVALGLAVALVLAIIIGNKIAKSNNFSYQVRLAEEKLSESQYLEAIEYYENALKLEPDNADISFKIADIYYSMGRINDAIYTLIDMASDSGFDDKEKTLAYEKIISLYEETSGYSAIAELLSTCENETILNKYSKFLVKEPEFSLEAGTYEETMALKLSSLDNCVIYYTIDGIEPTEASSIYDMPIFLEYGSYTVSAFSENEYGVRSEVVKKKYLIDVDFKLEPDILTDSGSYTNATMIEVSVPLMYTVFYTTDGTNPSKDAPTAIKYQNPIPMPLGDSHFKFIVYASDGSVSDVVSRDYSLILNTEIDPAGSVTILNNVLQESGEIEAAQGIVDLMYTAPYSVEEMGDFYFIVEYVTDGYGNRNKIGVFAIDCYNGKVYKVSVQNGSEYKLTPFN